MAPCHGSEIGPGRMWASGVRHLGHLQAYHRRGRSCGPSPTGLRPVRANHHNAALLISGSLRPKGSFITARLELNAISVTKLDAAERQLREAIRLFLEDRDPLAIHTLASAAAQITADLLRAKGVPSIIRSGAMIKDERRAEVLGTIRAPENFLKHADNDPGAVLRFNSDATPFFIFAAIAEFQLLAGRQFPGADVFLIWFYMKYPDVIAETPETAAIRAAVVRAHASGLSAEDKAAFLELLAAMK